MSPPSPIENSFWNRNLWMFVWDPQPLMLHSATGSLMRTCRKALRRVYCVTSVTAVLDWVTATIYFRLIGKCVIWPAGVTVSFLEIVSSYIDTKWSFSVLCMLRVRVYWSCDLYESSFLMLFFVKLKRAPFILWHSKAEHAPSCERVAITNR